jgi:NAD(P)H dehydrogenase (quinone)
MRFHIVFAHPEAASLNAFLRDRALSALRAAGHEFTQSDLYTMGFKAVADGADCPDDNADPLIYHAATRRAHALDKLSADILAEQAKLLAADVIVLQFPLWWFGMPAIIKGWADRVFCSGFAIGVPHIHKRAWRRYGEGPLEGKLAMLAVTTGAKSAHLSDRGEHGPIADLLFPINHGLLHYAGATVVEPFLIHGASSLSGLEADRFAATYCERLLDIDAATVIPYRSENGGAYRRGVLVEDTAAGSGFALHIGEPVRSADEEQL